MKTITLYSPEELKKENPAAFDKALEYWKVNQSEIFWTDEIIGSMKAIFEAAGVVLKDWSIGAYSYSYLEARIEPEEAGEFTGNRALKWLENHLYGPLRIPWKGSKRWELAKYGSYYRPGMIPPCPFTGYCADEDYLDSIRKDIREGCTIQEAFENLAQVASKLLEQESEYQQSEENFLEQDHLEITESGVII